MRSSIAFLAGVLGACSPSGDGGPGGDVDAQVITTHPDAHADARPPSPDAPVGTVCAVKDPVVQLIYTCTFDWKQCSGSMPADHRVQCTIQAAGSLRFSLCNCLVGGVAQPAQFTSTTICGAASWPDLEAIANEKCGWNLR